MTLIIPGAYQVVIEMQASGQQVLNVIGIKDLEGTEDPVSLIGNTVKNAWEIASGPLSKLPSQVSMVGYHVTSLYAADSPKGSVGSTTAGGKTGQEMSTLATCAVVKLSGGSRSRSNNGRMYFGPLYEAIVNADGRTVSGPYITELAAAIALFRTELDTANLPLAVLSRKNSTATVVTGTSVGGIIGIQRRRLR